MASASTVLAARPSEFDPKRLNLPLDLTLGCTKTALLETLTLGLGPSFAKAVLKLWLPDHPVLTSTADGVIEIMKKRGESFATSNATDRLFRNLSSDVAERLQKVVEVEFPSVPESDREAAALAVAATFEKLDLPRAMMRADLNAADLELVAKPVAHRLFADLEGDTRALAELLLRETCGYAVALAGKLPDFEVAAAREILKRTNELGGELSRLLDVVGAMRDQSSRNDSVKNFETLYRRAFSQRLDRMQLFGMRLVGAGARELEISVAYVALTLSHANSYSNNVGDVLTGLKRILIRGEAGSGKTTLMHWLGIRASRRDFEGPLETWNTCLPFFVSLRDFSDGQFPIPERFVGRVVPNLAGLMPPGWVQQELSRGALVLIDGVDEVPAARRGDMLEWLAGLVQDFPNSIYILSSRPAAIDGKIHGITTIKRFESLAFEQVILEPMSLRDSETLVRLWHRAVGRNLVDTDHQSRLQHYELELILSLRERSSIRSLASNPLLCSMICVLNWDRQQKLPEDRMQLYSLALEILVHARDIDRGVTTRGLNELDASTKLSLLDGLAYWMLRNGVIEADRNEVEAQIDILLQRHSRISNGPAVVLQELLERSGILRQPQIGVVDFVHRTFLEYMAARAAVTAGDFGFLASKANDDSWRETIVFAAGHAQGIQRDQLITRLLKKPLFKLKSKTTDVTAACCLETAGTNLRRDLLSALNECARSLFPPMDLETARVLAPAANHEPELLKGYTDPRAIAACIRCASIVGGRAMLNVINSYKAHSDENVWRELLAAWTSFDPVEYRDQIIKSRPSQCFGKIGVSMLDSDAFEILEWLVLKGLHESMDMLGNIVAEFYSKKHLDLQCTYESENDLGAAGDSRAGLGRNSWYNNESNSGKFHVNINAVDAKRISSIRSTHKLSLGSCDTGVLRFIAELPILEELSYWPTTDRDVGPLTKAKMLRFLEITDRCLADKGGELNLNDLCRCEKLTELAIVGFSDAEIHLSSLNNITKMSLAKVGRNVIKQLSNLSRLERLYLEFRDGDNTIIDLRGHGELTHIHLVSRGIVQLQLPASVKSLCFGGSDEVYIKDSGNLENVNTITMTGVKSIKDARTLFSIKSLRLIVLDKQTRNVLWRELDEHAVARNLLIYILDGSQSPVKNP